MKKLRENRNAKENLRADKPHPVRAILLQTDKFIEPSLKKAFTVNTNKSEKIEKAKMRSKSPYIALGIYVLAGFIGFVALFIFNNGSDERHIRREIDIILNSKGSSGELLDSLPVIFERIPTAVAVILSNNYGHLVGSMYEGKRLPAEHYKIMVDEFKKNSFDYSTQQLPALMREFDLHKAENSEKSAVVYLVARRSTSVGDVVRYWRRQQSNIFWIVLVYLSGAIGIFFITSHIADSGKAAFRMMSSREVSKRSAAPPQAEPGAIERDVRQLQKSVLFENQLSTVLAQITERFLVKRITFLLNENNTWKVVLQKRGAMYVKGESVQIPEILTSQDFATMSAEGNHQPLVSNDSTEMLFPVMVKGQMAGAFHLQSDNPRIFSDKEAQELQHIIQSFGRNLLVQQSYEKAIVDDETGLYSYPYFYFSLKERIISGKAFSTLIFQVDNANSLTPESLRRFARQLMLLLGEFAPSATAARLESARFGIIFSEDENSKENQNTQMWAVASKIRDTAITYLHQNVYGALLSKPADIKQLEAFLRSLQNALNDAIKTKSFSVHKHQTVEGVL